jgi:hypothetical protein
MLEWVAAAHRALSYRIAGTHELGGAVDRTVKPNLWMAAMRETLY